MQLLKRTPRTVPMDEYLSYFTSVEATEFRRLVGSAFAKAGRDVTIHSEHVEDRTGTVFGLWNIAALCRGVAQSGWPAVIEDHVQRVTTPVRGLGELSREELTAGLYLRLADAGSLPDPGELGYARQVAPGLFEVLAVDLPDSVATLRKDDVAALGPLGELTELGRANLLGLLDTDGLAAATVTDAGDVSFTEVTGGSFFTASLALTIRETVRRFSGDDWGRAALVAVPCRRQLLYHVLDGRRSAPSLSEMFSRARTGFHDGSGPLSPNVYLVRDRRWLPVTSVEDDGPRVLVRGEQYPT